MIIFIIFIQTNLISWKMVMICKIGSQNTHILHSFYKLIKQNKNLLTLIGAVMSTSPKIVKINLMQQSKKHRTTPSKKNPKPETTEVQQFSFSEDIQSQHLTKKSPKKSKPPSPISKKLFDTSPKKPKNHYTNKLSSDSDRRSIDKIRQKYRKMNPNYEKVDETDQFFKKSIDKLKRSFFKNDKNSKQATKKILKEIGKYAQNRSRSRSIKKMEDSSALGYKFKQIPVHFYGFQESLDHIKIHKQKQHIQKGTYLNFERAYQLSLSNNNKQLNNIDYKSATVQYVSKQNLKQQTFFDDHEDFKPAERDQIGQKQIDIICQIFEYCEKHDQKDVITIDNLNCIVDQFERLYRLASVQMSSQKNHKQQYIPQIRFYTLLKEFQEDLRVIFYRKHENNIYDALYYLKQTNHLQLVCEDFIKIKNILKI